MRRYCKGKTRTGAKCKRIVTRGVDFCPAHVKHMIPFQQEISRVSIENIMKEKKIAVAIDKFLDTNSRFALWATAKNLRIYRSISCFWIKTYYKYFLYDKIPKEVNLNDIEKHAEFCFKKIQELANKPMIDYINEAEADIPYVVANNLAIILKPIYMSIMFSEAETFIRKVLNWFPVFLNDYPLHESIILSHIDDANKQQFIIHIAKAFLRDYDKFEENKKLFKIEE